MNVTSYKVTITGTLFVVGVLCAGVGRSVAAEGPEYLQPVAEKSPSTTAPMANGRLQPSGVYEQAPVTSVDEEPCTEFCGTTVCSPPGRFWLRADYLMWWTSGMKLPALVATGSVANPTVLYGNSTVDDGGRSGYRGTLGMWIDACHVYGIEFDYLNLGEQASDYSRFSTGDPNLFRPFFNVQPNSQGIAKGPDGEIVASPGVSSGTVSVTAKDYFQSAGVTLSYNLCSCNGCCDSCDGGNDACDCTCGPPSLNCCRADLLLGFRCYDLNDSVGIHENLTGTSPTFATFDIHDNFTARNEFYGSELGLRTRLYRKRWSLEVLTKIAMGNTHQTATIGGQTVKTTLEGTTVYTGGLLALDNPPANIGTYQQDTFTLIPQLGLELGYQLSCHWRAYVGYNVMYWGSVWRAADQIDLHVDPRNVPSNPNFSPTSALPFPQFPAQASAFWAQGVNVGLERRF